MADAATITAVARLGGLAKAARYDGVEGTAAARATYRASFSSGHSCALCPAVAIPADLPLAERERRGLALRRAHFVRLGMARRRSNKAA